MLNLSEGDWFFGVLLETCQDLDRSISRPRVRPVEVMPSDLRVEFPRYLREKHPLRTRFRADVKVCQKHWSNGTPKGPVYLRAETGSIVRNVDYTPNEIIMAIRKAGSISGRAYDWITLPSLNSKLSSSFIQLRRIAYNSATLEVHPNRRNRAEVAVLRPQSGTRVLIALARAEYATLRSGRAGSSARTRSINRERSELVSAAIVLLTGCRPGVCACLPEIFKVWEVN